MSKPLVCLLVCLASLTPAWAMAQGGSVSGRVIDPQGAAVGGVDVVLASASGSSRSARSRADGSFTIDGVPAGTYTLHVEASGFAPFAESVTVGSGAATANVSLQVAGVVEGITVQGALLGTANTGKTTVPVRDLPLTVNGVSSAVIAEQGVNDLVTALENVSGVYPFTTYGVYEYYSFRGFLSSVQLVDGIRNEGNRVNTQLTNIERVEVLKGPSSALYGGSALGATVNLIRKKPSAAPSYDAMAAFGNWQTGRGAFGATGRIGGSESTLFRFDVGGEGREGYRHDEAKRVTITPSLAWRIGANNQVNVYYTMNRDQFGGDAGLPLVDTSLGVPTEDNVVDVPRDRNYRTPFDDATSFDQNIQVAYARQLTGSLGFRNTFSFRRFNDKYLLSEEVDFIAPRTVDRYYLYFNHHRRPLMNVAELTAHTRTGVEQDFVFGWESQRYHNYTTLPDEDFFSAESIDAFAPVETQTEPSIVITRQNVFTNTTNAFYAQDHLTLSPKVKLLVGGRADIYRRNSHSDGIDGDTVTEGTLVRRETEAFTGRAGVVVQPVPRVDLYGSYATSFTPLTQAQPDGRTLEPEKGEQWEFGQRFRMVKDRMQLNTSIYRLLRQNVAFRRPGNVFVQAGEVESKGFEADLETVPSANWRLNLGYAFTDAEFNDFEVSAGTNLRGNTPAYAPRHTFNLWAGYEWPSGFGVSGGARYFGSVFVDQENSFSVDSYGLLNLAARYRKGPLEYAVNVNNVTGTKYLVPHQDYLQVYPGEPVNVLATVRVHWN
jgi:iron complex outermembrane recepter protein